MTGVKASVLSLRRRRVTGNVGYKPELSGRKAASASGVFSALSPRLKREGVAKPAVAAFLRGNLRIVKYQINRSMRG